MKDINNIYNIELDGNILNSKSLYESIEKSYSENISEYKIEINNKKYVFDVKKNNIKEYEIKYNDKNICLVEKTVIIEKDRIFDSQTIYCYNNLISLLKYYDFHDPYIFENGIKNKFNMEKVEGDIKSFDNKTMIVEEYKPNDCLITKEEFELNKTFKTNSLNLRDKIEKRKPECFGKYTLDYLEGIKKEKTLYYFHNENLICFLHDTDYKDKWEGMQNFRFLTGSSKCGKTFSLLCAIRFDKENYKIYLNDRVISELENKGKYDEIKKMFFYEISRIFYEYDDYINFSTKFLGEIKEKNGQKLDFKVFLMNFIDKIDSFMKDKNEKYQKLQMIIDDFELDETNQKVFEKNIKFINDLYEKREKDSIIHFTFISPINNNYIKRCVLLSLDNDSRYATTGLTKKENNIVYYPFIFSSNCFYDPKENSINDYKNEIIKKNQEELKIPNKYLDSINYSLFHLNNIINICGDKRDQNTVETKAKEYINKLEEESEKFVSLFYEKEGCLFVYDLSEVDKYHEKLKTEEYFYYEELISILNCIPIQFITFDLVYINTGDNNKIERKFKISYKYDFYKNSITKYLDYFKNEDYNEKKNYKPGQKGDMLKDKIIDAITNGYFTNFKPDHIISIKNIFELSKYSEENRNKYEGIIKKFEDAFSNKKFHLIMIKQEQSNAEKYDFAFIEQYKSGKFQFILCQATRKKKPSQMMGYNSVKEDCYNFANFFSIFDNFQIKRYHFFFIFQSGIAEDKDSMKYCDNNNMKYIKFCIKNKIPLFLDSNNNQIKELIFNQTSNSMVELIRNNSLEKIDNESSESDYSYTGHKRARVNKNSKAKYIFGINIYKSVKKILGNKDYELSEKNHYLEEGKYFNICHRRDSNNKKIYYLLYMKDGKTEIQIINNSIIKKEKDSNQIKNDDIKSQFNLFKHGIDYECFQLVDND